MSLRRRGELYLGPDRLELLPIQDGTVAYEQHLLPGRLQLGGQVAGRRHLVLPHPHHPPWHPSVERVEDLSTPGIDDGPDQPARVADPEGQDIE